VSAERTSFRFVGLLAGACLGASLLLLSVIRSPVTVQAQGNPRLTVEADCSTFAFAPDNRIVYAVRHLMKTKHYDLQRDDIWVTTLEGKKLRIVNGEKFVKSLAPFSYAIQSLRWSPDGKRLTVEMLTDEVIDARGTTREGLLTDLMNDDGKEIEIAGTKNSVIPNGTQAAWLGDGETVAFLTEAVKPKLLYSIGTVRPTGGRGGPVFEGHTFSAVAWDAPHNAAVAIERDRSLSGPIQLVRLDLIKQSRRELAVLEGYLGQLSLSPSGARVAYFHDGDTMEIRELAALEKVTRVTAVYGHYEWSPDERRVLLKRGPEKKSGDLTWVSIPDGKLDPILHDLTFHDFRISPDGVWLAVTEPGRRSLMVYPLP